MHVRHKLKNVTGCQSDFFFFFCSNGPNFETDCSICVLDFSVLQGNMSISKNTVDRCAFSSQVKFVYSLLILQGGPETYRVGIYKRLSLIVGFAVSVAIWPREVASCRDFILHAVATFWAMSLIGIYPGRASSRVKFRFTIRYSLPADVLWVRNECVTNEPQRTSAGRLYQVILLGIIKKQTRESKNSKDSEISTLNLDDHDLKENHRTFWFYTTSFRGVKENQKIKQIHKQPKILFAD